MGKHVLLLLTVGVLLAGDDPKTAAEKEGTSHNWKAVGYIIKCDYDKAVAECTEAIRLDPKNDLPYLNRGSAYSLKGEHDKAVADFDQAIRLNPTNGAPYSNRAAAYAAKGYYGEAIKGFEQAIKIEPTRGDTYGHLADLLATCPKAELRDGKRAVGLATKACELTKWNDTISLSALAAAYAEVGDFKKAVEWQRKAMKASGSLVLKREQDVEESRQRLKCYGEGKP
jgi:tetratricopeptide (TPR) repeat protein